MKCSDIVLLTTIDHCKSDNYYTEGKVLIIWLSYQRDQLSAVSCFIGQYCKNSQSSKLANMLTKNTGIDNYNGRSKRRKTQH